MIQMIRKQCVILCYDMEAYVISPLIFPARASLYNPFGSLASHNCRDMFMYTYIVYATQHQTICFFLKDEKSWLASIKDEPCIISLQASRSFL